MPRLPNIVFLVGLILFPFLVVWAASTESYGLAIAVRIIWLFFVLIFLGVSTWATLTAAQDHKAVQLRRNDLDFPRLMIVAEGEMRRAVINVLCALLFLYPAILAVLFVPGEDRPAIQLILIPVSYILIAVLLTYKLICDRIDRFRLSQ